MAFTNLSVIDPIKLDSMQVNECERDLQLELNRNYLKSFPARLKCCHIVSAYCNELLCYGFPSDAHLNIIQNSYAND